MILDIMLLLTALVVPTSSWLTFSRISWFGQHCAIPRKEQRRRFQPKAPLLFSDVVDVEFEHVNRKNQTSSGQRHIAALSDEIVPKSLLDIALESDSDFNETRIPFLDYTTTDSKDGGTNYIDVKIAFMAELEGVQYGIGIPFDHAVALTLESEDGSVKYLSPDDDDNEELMNIMATQLHDHVDPGLQLSRTPRVLTVVGPLDKYTMNWKEILLPSPVEAKTLIDTEDEDLDFFHRFMKEELGEKEYEKTLNEEGDDDLTAELLELFDIPGLGVKKDDPESIQELLDTILDPELEFEKAKTNLGLDKFEHDGVALKLISYIFREGKSYSLVKLLRPYVLVGRFMPGNDDPHFELLSPNEEKMIIPKLQETCEADLEKLKLPKLST